MRRCLISCLTLASLIPKSFAACLVVSSAVRGETSSTIEIIRGGNVAPKAPTASVFCDGDIRYDKSDKNASYACGAVTFLQVTCKRSGFSNKEFAMLTSVETLNSVISAADFRWRDEVLSYKS